MANEVDEIWKDITEFGRLEIQPYQVSNLGRVRSHYPFRSIYTGRERKDGSPIFSRLPSRIIKPQDNGNGYYTVILYYNGPNGECRRRLVHRLVAKAFLPNPNHLTDVNHKDGNRKNNLVDNLEWCSRSENILHASRVLHTLTYHGKAVRCVETGEEFPSIKEAARHYGVADTNLGNAIRGKGQKRCAGYHWEFI